MQTSSAGRAAIERREGVMLTAYKDSVGVLTIGCGHTSAAGSPKVTASMKITAAQADEILSRDLASVEAAVSRSVTVPINQNEFDALVSLCFNIGATAFRKSTLVRKLNAGDRAGAANAFLSWNKGTVNGKKVAIRGLTIRRQDERKQFLTPVAEAPKAIVVEKPVPVPVETPVVPASMDKTVKKHTRNWGWGGIASGGVGAAVTSALGDWKIVALFAGIGIAGAIVAFIAGPLIVRRFKEIRAEVEG